jgi:sulfite exporter TauE/SafE
MPNALITHLQIFGIGLSFGLAGPCFLSCAPILITYLAGKKGPWVGALRDVFIFLTGRLAAYCVLGYAAGLSAGLLNRFTNPQAASFFKPLAGAISILLGITLLLAGEGRGRECGPSEGKLHESGGLLGLGFALGIAPCAPLAALLFEIALMSKSAFDGFSYALSFGMGTFISGLITIGVIAGVVKWIPSKFLRSKTGSVIFRAACSVLLILLGFSLIFTRTNHI